MECKLLNKALCFLRDSPNGSIVRCRFISPDCVDADTKRRLLPYYNMSCRPNYLVSAEAIFYNLFGVWATNSTTDKMGEFNYERLGR